MESTAEDVLVAQRGAFREAERAGRRLTYSPSASAPGSGSLQHESNCVEVTPLSSALEGRATFRPSSAQERGVVGGPRSGARARAVPGYADTADAAAAGCDLPICPSAEGTPVCRATRSSASTTGRMTGTPSRRRTCSARRLVE
jgi:hypothetical protein